eukprot:9425534-Ditylum_brightwellii.AAC.1
MSSSKPSLLTTTNALSKGHSNKPINDGPANFFEADPELTKILPPQHPSSTATTTTTTKGSEFGLLAVTLWPPPLNLLREPYNTFLSCVRDCFDKQDILAQPHDVAKDSSSGIGPAAAAAVYMYPPECLHVTISTFHPFTK